MSDAATVLFEKQRKLRESHGMTVAFLAESMTDVQSLIDGDSDNFTVEIKPGTYNPTETLKLINKDHVHIKANGVNIEYGGTASNGIQNHPIIDMTGSRRCTIEGLRVDWNPGDTHRPSCALLLARNETAASSHQNSFMNCVFQGYFTKAAVLMVCAESDVFFRCEITNYANVSSGAYALWITSDTPSGVGATGTLGLSSMLTAWFYDCTFTRWRAIPTGGDRSWVMASEDAAIYIESNSSGTGDIHFIGGQMSGPSPDTGNAADNVNDSSKLMKAMLKLNAVGTGRIGRVSVEGVRVECGAAKAVWWVQGDDHTTSYVSGIRTRANYMQSAERLFVSENNVTVEDLDIDESEFYSLTSCNWAYDKTDGTTLDIVASDRTRAVVDVGYIQDSYIKLGARLVWTTHGDTSSPTSDFRCWTTVRARAAATRCRFRAQQTGDVGGVATGGQKEVFS